MYNYMHIIQRLTHSVPTHNHMLNKERYVTLSLWRRRRELTQMSLLIEYHMTYNISFHSSTFLNMTHTQSICILARPTDPQASATSL